MNTQILVDSLVQCRNMSYTLWEQYHEEAKEKPFYSGLRDRFEMEVRALDYAMEVLRRDAL